MTRISFISISIIGMCFLFSSPCQKRSSLSSTASVIKENIQTYNLLEYFPIDQDYTCVRLVMTNHSESYLEFSKSRYDATRGTVEYIEKNGDLIYRIYLKKGPKGMFLWEHAKDIDNKEGQLFLPTKVEKGEQWEILIRSIRHRFTLISHRDECAGVRGDYLIVRSESAPFNNTEATYFTFGKQYGLVMKESHHYQSARPETASVSIGYNTKFLMDNVLREEVIKEYQDFKLPELQKDNP